MALKVPRTHDAGDGHALHAAEDGERPEIHGKHADEAPPECAVRDPAGERCGCAVRDEGGEEEEKRDGEHRREERQREAQENQRGVRDDDRAGELQLKQIGPAPVSTPNPLG